MNRYKKYCPNVFVVESDDDYKRGDIVEIETKYGKINEAIIINKVAEIGDKKLYSQIRADGFNMQERAKGKAEKYDNWSASASKKSDNYHNASNKDSDFLSLGEPIKIGHHSENRHRKIIADANNNFSKAMELNDKAMEHSKKSEYWEARENEINLSMPESIDFYCHKLEQAKEAYLVIKKQKPAERQHSYSLTYANKNMKNAQTNYDIAIILWR